MSSTRPVGLSNEDLERAFKSELEINRDPEVALDIYKMGSGSLKVSLIKLCNSDRETLLHLLANQILNNQEEAEDTSSLIESAFEILSTGELKKDLKELVTCQDDENFSFLDSAIFCRNKKLNFVYQILNIVPLEDRDKCKMNIAGSFKDVLRNDEKAEELRVINALISLFHLSKDSDKTTLAKSLLDKIKRSPEINQPQKDDIIANLQDSSSSPSNPKNSEDSSARSSRTTRPSRLSASAISAQLRRKGRTEKPHH